MKKYFMKGTEDEIQFGDELELDLTKEMENGHTKHHHFECKFIPELIPLLLENDIIEVQECDDEPEDEGPLNFSFDDYEESLSQLIDCYQELNDSVSALIEEVKELKNAVLAVKEPKKDAKKAGK